MIDPCSIQKYQERIIDFIAFYQHMIEQVIADAFGFAVDVVEDLIEQFKKAVQKLIKKISNAIFNASSNGSGLSLPDTTKLKDQIQCAFDVVANTTTITHQVGTIVGTFSGIASAADGLI